MSGSIGYFICTLDSMGHAVNCSPIEPPQTIAADDMLIIIGALWSAIAVAFVVRLMAKAISTS